MPVVSSLSSPSKGGNPSSSAKKVHGACKRRTVKEKTERSAPLVATKKKIDKILEC
ncbi:hypothetical protein Syun_008974 [Stephania yunnanensis]|uniref:Uncharacterized protein n=1 Tax=Stephania yunnanensis TaxID=152371 RepID=A0AAP0KER0_9MAGN